jgi:hypothetical protein
MMGKLEHLTGSFVNGIYILSASMVLCAIVLFFLGLGNRPALRPAIPLNIRSTTLPD